jgi:SAM-dependent methyltransferase
LRSHKADEESIGMNARTQLPSPGPSALWSALSKQWRLIDVPLRPCRDDLRVFEGTVRERQRAQPARGVRGLLLGVTVEIATMRWPAAASVVAVDHSLPMVANVWPKPAHGTAVCADWRSMPLASHSRDVALGDGCLTLLPWPHGHRAFAESLRRVLADDGVLALRCFCRPEKRETPGQVFDDLRARRIRGFHAFKWRLAMALHGPAGEGVRLADVWDCWSNEIADPDALAAQCGWPAELVRSMEVYRGSETRYTFLTADEACRSLMAEFTLKSQHVGSYELAERCPILVFRPR